MPLPIGEHTHLLDRIQGVFSQPDLVRSLTAYRELMSAFVQREGEAWFDAGDGNDKNVDFVEEEDDILDDEDSVPQYEDMMGIDPDIPRSGEAHYSGEPTPVVSNAYVGAYRGSTDADSRTLASWTQPATRRVGNRSFKETSPTSSSASDFKNVHLTSISYS